MIFNEGVERFFEILNEISKNYFYICDMRTETFRYSKNLVEILNLPGEIIKNPLPVWKEIVHPEDWEKFYTANTVFGKDGNDDHSVEFRVKSYDGEYIWLRCSGKVIYDEDKQPIMLGGIMTELGQINHRDYLTNLYTREVFQERVKTKCRMHESFAMMKLDIDNFKIFNEIYNRTTGDFVIKRFTELAQEVVGEDVRIYKMDADGISVLLNDATEADVSDVYRRIRVRLEEEPSLSALGYPVNISAGCVFSAQDTQDAEELIKNCDLALQYAKENGKTRLVYFSPEIKTDRQRSFEIQKYLDRSVKNDFRGFELNYQLQVDARTGAYKGAEALLRWESEKTGKVSPLEFIPVLEKNGLIVPVGIYIIRQAMRDLKKWLPYQPDFLISVNVSVLQMTESDFVRDIERLIEEEGISPSHIILEMTESCMVENRDVLKDILRQLHDLGFKIAIDDFGTGYSSLGILKTIQTDIVKIDKIFVENIRNSRSEQIFIQSITDLCHGMGMKVVQEGVEDEMDAEILKEIGIDYIQGFLYSRPQENESVLKQLKQVYQKGMDN